jgi:Flp pilus assembly protein TadB
MSKLARKSQAFANILQLMATEIKTPVQVNTMMGLIAKNETEKKFQKFVISCNLGGLMMNA